MIPPKIFITRLTKFISIWCPCMILRTFFRVTEGIKTTNLNLETRKDKNNHKYIEFIAGYRSS